MPNHPTPWYRDLLAHWADYIPAVLLTVVLGWSAALLVAILTAS